MVHYYTAWKKSIKETFFDNRPNLNFNIQNFTNKKLFTQKETSHPKLTLTIYLKQPVGLCSARQKFFKQVGVLTIWFIYSFTVYYRFLFVVFAFYSFYKIVKSRFFIGYNFFQGSAQNVYMFKKYVP